MTKKKDTSTNNQSKKANVGENLPDFGKLIKVPLRNIWKKEAKNFTRWLKDNIEILGKALGMELEVIDDEVQVGKFKLDLHAEERQTSRQVAIENQLNKSDHKHLGQLLTYAAGLEVSVIIWVAEDFEKEHRQALEWLNQRTDIDVQFFAVEIEALKICESDRESKPAPNFKPVVSPIDWQDKQRASNVKSRGKKEKNRVYFQMLIDEIKDRPEIANPSAKEAKGSNSWGFPSGVSGVTFRVIFPIDRSTGVEIYMELSEPEKNKRLFDVLKGRQEEIAECISGESELRWHRMDESKHSRIGIYRKGTTDADEGELEEIQRWHIDTLLKFREKLTPIIQESLDSLD